MNRQQKRRPATNTKESHVSALVAAPLHHRPLAVDLCCFEGAYMQSRRDHAMRGAQQAQATRRRWLGYVLDCLALPITTLSVVAAFYMADAVIRAI